MTKQAESRGSAALASRGQAVFEKLIHPLSPEEFFADYWGKRHLHIARDDPDYHSDVLKFADIDGYLSRNDLRYPYIRLVKEGRELPLADYANDRVYGENLFQGNLDLDALFREYVDGATMCMQLQHLAMPTLGAFTRAIEAYFGYRTQSTIFLTPSNSHGFTRHFDSHDFFTLGLNGEKTWRIYSDKVEYPLPRTEVLDSEVDISDEMECEFKVRAGDTLYVPRGVYHDARGESGSSAQISLGIFPYYWCDVLHRLIDDLANQHPPLRRAVAPIKELDRAALQDTFREMIAFVASEGDIIGTIEALQRASGAKRLQVGDRRLTDLELLERLNPDSVLQAREIDPQISEEGGRLVVSFYDKRVSLPASARSQLEIVISGTHFTARSLPPSIDLPGRLVLVRKLIAEGLVTFVEGAVVRAERERENEPVA